MTQMKKKETAKSLKKKKKTHRTGILFTVCLILVLAPFVVLGWILFSSSLDTGTPVLGNRFEGDLDPAITKDQMNQVETAVKALEGQDDAFVTMTTATLRVYVDVADDANEDTVNAKADEVYNTVASILDPSVYFTKTDDKKQYDLEIHVYTKPERTDEEGENFVYVIDTKTSNMSEPQKQTVSVAKDQAVADQLRQDVLDREAAASASAEAQENGGEISGGEEVPAEGETSEETSE
jgi:flagellar basal body-associated protein FliL